MTDDILRDLQRLHGYASALQDAMARAAELAPRSVRGTDESGAVEIELDGSGVLAVFRVAADWRRRLDPDAVGRAVMEAYGSAVLARMTPWTAELDRSGWRSSVDRLDGESAPLAPDLPDVQPRRLDEVAEDVLRAVDRIDEFTRTPNGQGESQSGHVRISVTSGALVSCDVDPQWAARSEGEEVARALTQALEEARTSARREARPPFKQLDELLAEAMAILRDPQADRDMHDAAE